MMSMHFGYSFRGLSIILRAAVSRAILCHSGLLYTGEDIGEAAPNHSPYFDVNESALKTGVRVLTGHAIGFLHGEVEK